MDVELPSSGCNIINSSTSFYNYHSDDHTRDTYIIFDGQAILQTTSTSQYGYTYTGTCLNTGDLVYKPELQVYFPLLSMVLFGFTLWLVWRTIIRSLLP